MWSMTNLGPSNGLCGFRNLFRLFLHFLNSLKIMEYFFGHFGNLLIYQCKWDPPRPSWPPKQTPKWTLGGWFLEPLPYFYFCILAYFYTFTLVYFHTCILTYMHTCVLAFLHATLKKSRTFHWIRCHFSESGLHQIVSYLENQKSKDTLLYQTFKSWRSLGAEIWQFFCLSEEEIDNILAPGQKIKK